MQRLIKDDLMPRVWQRVGGKKYLISQLAFFLFVSCPEKSLLSDTVQSLHAYPCSCITNHHHYTKVLFDYFKSLMRHACSMPLLPSRYMIWWSLMINLPSKMCKEESSPHDVLCGRHQSEPCSVSGGEVGRALYLPLYLHLCS